jgi:hypothetical protein
MPYTERCSWLFALALAGAVTLIASIVFIGNILAT